MLATALHNTEAELSPSGRQVLTTALRTPEARFEDLVDWPYLPKYMEDLPGFEGLRLHYVEMGKPTACRTVICIHGQKTWGYAFRKTIEHFISNGYRVIIPDLFGFGRSDKPANDCAYDFNFHRNTIIRLIEKLKLDEFCLAGFDWGGWLAATLPMDLDNRVAGLLLGNTNIHCANHKPWSGFHVWKALHNAQIDPIIGRSIMQENECLTKEEAAAYDAPFPTFRFKAGVRKFPNLVPLSQSHPTAAISERALKFLGYEWTGKTSIVASMDLISGLKAAKQLQAAIQGANNVIKIDSNDTLIFEYADKFMPDALEQLL